mgnify:CR=1 FL=1
MKLGKALAIVVQIATSQRGSPALAESLAVLRALAAADLNLLDDRIEDIDRRELAARLPRGPGFQPRRLARALLHASDAALPAIPSIDHRATREEAKRALRAVAVIERFAAAMGPRRVAGAATAA